MSEVPLQTRVRQSWGANLGPRQAVVAAEEDEAERVRLRHRRHRVRHCPGKGNSNSHGARPVHWFITMIKWIRTSRLSVRRMRRSAFASVTAATVCVIALLRGRNVKRFRGGLVFEAHRLVYHSTLGCGVQGVGCEVRRMRRSAFASVTAATACVIALLNFFAITSLGFKVWGLGVRGLGFCHTSNSKALHHFVMLHPCRV